MAVVLVVEDDPVISGEVAAALEAHGHEAVVARSGRQALDLVAGRRADLVLLDLGLPDLDGVHVCRTLRASHPTMPIVMVTARDDEIDIVVGLDAGATDYVVKPFSLAVLLARVRAHLRAPAAFETDVVVIDDLEVDIDAHRARRGGAEIDLRPREFALLVALVRQAGRVMTRDRLLEDVWDLQWESSTKTLDMHVSALRRKLGERDDGRPWITTVRSVGYRFELT
jgi:DNA-binding response OmpR family regulator